MQPDFRTNSHRLVNYSPIGVRSSFVFRNQFAHPSRFSWKCFCKSRHTPNNLAMVIHSLSARSSTIDSESRSIKQNLIKLSHASFYSSLAHGLTCLPLCWDLFLVLWFLLSFLSLSLYLSVSTNHHFSASPLLSNTKTGPQLMSFAQQNPGIRNNLIILSSWHAPKRFQAST